MHRLKKTAGKWKPAPSDEEAYEIHLLECRSCLVRAEAVEQALRFHHCFQGEIRDMRDLRRKLFPLVVVFLWLAEQAKALPVSAAPSPQGPGPK